MNGKWAALAQYSHYRSDFICILICFTAWPRRYSRNNNAHRPHKEAPASPRTVIMANCYRSHRKYRAPSRRLLRRLCTMWMIRRSSNSSNNNSAADRRVPIRGRRKALESWKESTTTTFAVMSHTHSHKNKTTAHKRREIGSSVVAASVKCYTCVRVCVCSTIFIH